MVPVYLYRSFSATGYVLELLSSKFNTFTDRCCLISIDGFLFIKFTYFS